MKIGHSSILAGQLSSGLLTRLSLAGRAGPTAVRETRPRLRQPLVQVPPLDRCGAALHGHRPELRGTAPPPEGPVLDKHAPRRATGQAGGGRGQGEAGGGRRQGEEEGREQENGEEGDSGAGRREVGRQAAATPWRASHILARVPNVLHRRRAGR